MGKKSISKSADKAPVLSGGSYTEKGETLLLLKVELLREIDLFRIMPRGALENIAKKTKDIIFKKDEILFEEGLKGRNMYVILSGEVLVFRGAKKVALLKQGEYLGEMSMVDAKSRSASAKALSDTLVMDISEELFSEYAPGGRTFEVEGHKDRKLRDPRLGRVRQKTGVDVFNVETGVA